MDDILNRHFTATIRRLTAIDATTGPELGFCTGQRREQRAIPPRNVVGRVSCEWRLREDNSCLQDHVRSFKVFLGHRGRSGALVDAIEHDDAVIFSQPFPSRIGHTASISTGRKNMG